MKFAASAVTKLSSKLFISRRAEVKNIKFPTVKFVANNFTTKEYELRIFTWLLIYSNDKVCQRNRHKDLSLSLTACLSFVRREIGIVRRKLALSQSGSASQKSNAVYYDTDDESEKEDSGE